MEAKMPTREERVEAISNALNAWVMDDTDHRTEVDAQIDADPATAYLESMRTVLLGVVLAAELALREWKMFSDEDSEDRDIETDGDTEAEWYRDAVVKTSIARRVLNSMPLPPAPGDAK